MRHIPDGVLRRLDDEPLAVADRVSDHLFDLWALRRPTRSDRARHRMRGAALLRTATRTRHRRRLGAASARVSPDQGGWCRRAPPAHAASPATLAPSETAAADRTGDRRGGDLDCRLGGSGHVDHDLLADSRRPGGCESERPAGDRGRHGARQYPAARRLRNSYRVKHAPVRNHHMVVGRLAAGFLACPGDR